MNEKFKLKPEARQFFSKDIAESIKPIEFWKERGIHINLLDAVDSVGQSSDLFFTTIDDTLKQIEDSKNKPYEFNNPAIK